MANIDEKAQKQQVISDALTLLEKNKEWEERYRGYISNALAKEKGKRRKKAGRSMASLPNSPTGSASPPNSSAIC